MRIFNDTDLDTDKIKELFLKVKSGLKSSGLIVEIVNTKRAYSGLAYHCVWYRLNRTDKRIPCNNAILLRINTQANQCIFYARARSGHKKYNCFNVYNLLTMVYLHEISHVKDYQNKKSSSYRQRHCDDYAIKQGIKFGIAWDIDRLVPAVIDQQKA